MTPRLHPLRDQLRTWGAPRLTAATLWWRALPPLRLRPWISLLTVGFVLAALLGHGLLVLDTQQGLLLAVHMQCLGTTAP